MAKSSGASKLRSLDIGCNSLSRRGYAALSFLMNNSPGLQSVFADENNGQLEDLSPLLEAVCENRSICCLGIDKDLQKLKQHSPDDGKYCQQRLTSTLAVNQSRHDASIRLPLFKTWTDIVHLNSIVRHGKLFLSLCLCFDCPDGAKEANIIRWSPKGTVQKGSLRPLFGTEIYLVETTSVDEYQSPIPRVLCLMRKCLEQQKAHLSSGIFRIAASSSEAVRVRSYFQQGVLPSDPQVDAVADSIKFWFRELPTRLLDVVPLSRLNAACSPEAAAELVLDLPEPWHSTSLCLLDICVWVCSHSDVSLMKSRSLAIVIAPKLISDARMDPMDTMQALKSATAFLEFAIVVRQNEMIGVPALPKEVETESGFQDSSDGSCSQPAKKEGTDPVSSSQDKQVPSHEGT
jgi:hypothetical protein